MQNDLLIEVENLSISFNSYNNKTIAVDDISFNIKKGEILGIVGESGSGKSLTALSIIGLLPSNAEINASKLNFFTDDKPLSLLHLNKKEKRKLRGNEISMIFQDPLTSLNPSMKVGKQVVEIMKIHKKLKTNLKSRCMELFEEVLLPSPEKIFYSYPHQLSGGQRQRIMIAMAIACNPKLIIADEPTTALDVTVQKTILQLLKNIKQKYNTSILFISHDLGVIANICDRVLVMYRGKIVEEMHVSFIPDKAQHPYTRGLLACRPPLNSKPEILPTVDDYLNNKIPTVEVKNSKNEIKTFNKVILEIKDLTKVFPLKSNIFSQKATLTAVDNVNLKIFENETVGLVGESGCGKTTLSRLILNLIKPTSGKIFFENQDISTLNRKQKKLFRRQVQIIFQDPYSSLNPLITIGNALVEPMKVHSILKNYRQRKEFVINLLEKVGLKADDFNKYPHQFSGGQRQRIVIARALVLQPKFIVCDEPVASLDVSIQAQVLNLLNSLKKEFNLTFLFISHDLAVVKFFSDRIIIMQKGKIIEEGTPDDIFANPQNQYTRNLIESIPVFEKK